MPYPGERLGFAAWAHMQLLLCDHFIERQYSEGLGPMDQLICMGTALTLENYGLMLPKVGLRRCSLSPTCAWPPFEETV